MKANRTEEMGDAAATTARPAALVPLDHPLCYPSLLPRSNNNGTADAAKHDAQRKTVPLMEGIPSTAEEKMTYLYEKDRILDVLHSYAYALDCCMVDSSYSSAWADLFTQDCKVTYPFGTCVGRDDLAKFAMKAELRFYRMVHMSSNMMVRFSSPTTAFARSTLSAVHSTHEHDLGQNFFEGGYYYWVLEKQGDEWKISSLFLDAVWWLGDSLGLNEPHDAAR